MRRALLSLFFIIILCSVSFSQMVLKADLEGSQVVPPVSTTATGTAWLFLYEDLGAIRFSFTFADLQGEFTNAYFNIGNPDETGDTIKSIIVFNNTADDNWDNLPDSLLSYLLAEDIYISIHSTAFPNGELRGQIKKVRGYGFPLGLMSVLMVPPVLTDARATGYLVLDNNAASIEYRFTITGVSGNVTNLSFNIGVLGENGPQVQSFDIQGSTVTGSWTGFGDSIITHMIKNRLYLKVSSANYPQGEIRGNLFRHGELMFRISLDGQQVIPAVNSTGTGTGWGVVSSNFSKVFYDLTYAKLSSPVTSVYFHNGISGINGDTLISLSFEGSKASGTWDFFSDFLLREIFKHRIYVTVNTLNYPEGEIRGQLELIRGIGFTSSLNGSGEIPANSSTAQGTGWFYINSDDSDTDTAYYRFTIAGLSSPFTGGFFHNAPYHSTGPAVEPMPFTDSTLTYGWYITERNTLSELVRGNIYVDIHSRDFLDGEIRGQVYFSNVQSGNTVDIKESTSAVPSDYNLSQNYPNPFNPLTTIRYAIAAEEFVSIKVYNSIGEEIATLINQMVKPGSYQMEWNASAFASGIYFYRIEAGKFSSTRKMILLK